MSERAIGNEGALRRPMTNDDHQPNPLIALQRQERHKMTLEEQNKRTKRKNERELKDIYTSAIYYHGVDKTSSSFKRNNVIILIHQYEVHTIVHETL